MRRRTRDLVRAVLPPILALGLVPLMMRPMDAAPVRAAAVATAESQLPSTGWDNATCPRTAKDHVAVGRDGMNHSPAAHVVPAPDASVAVSIPAVAFAELVQAVKGRVHTSVLVNASEPCGVATVVGSTGTCSVVAHPGVVAWLDCPLPKNHKTLTIAVRLSDGGSYSHSVAL